MARGMALASSEEQVRAALHELIGALPNPYRMIGRVRILLPVAAKIAFATAGPTAAVGASPMPPGDSAL